MQKTVAVLLGVAAIVGSHMSLAATVLHGGATVQVEDTLPDPTDLWVKAAALPEVNGFELKPEGACLDEICVPVRQDEDSTIYIRRQGVGWMNVTELARRVQQPYVVDHDQDVWSLGAIPAQRQGFLRSGIAPDFTLPDWRGNSVSLSDFKGKKIMLLTWASW